MSRHIVVRVCIVAKDYYLKVVHVDAVNIRFSFGCNLFFSLLCFKFLNPSKPHNTKHTSYLQNFYELAPVSLVVEYMVCWLLFKDNFSYDDLSEKETHTIKVLSLNELPILVMLRE